MLENKTTYQCVFLPHYKATLFTPRPLTIASPDNPVLGLYAVSSLGSATDEFIVISYEVSLHPDVNPLVLTDHCRYTEASAAISCASSLDPLTSVTEAVGLRSHQPTLAAGRCGDLCLQVTLTCWNIVFRTKDPYIAF
jgi:hypothetical protein